MKNIIASLMLLAFASSAWAVQTIVPVDITEGSYSVKEYLGANGHFEKNKGAWASYADAAGTSPVDGTGGSPTVTCTRTTTSPHSGVGSFLVTKDAANRQGEGCAVAFTIDTQDKGQVLTINASYSVASGTYADDAVRFYLYDVTNSKIIEPSANKIKNASGVNYIQPMEFQTQSDSTSYRLIIHVAGTDSTAYALKFDDIKVSKYKAPIGPFISDWQPYTPTLTSSGGGSITLNSTSKTDPNGYWRRVGDTVEIAFGFRNGTGGAATGNAGNIYISLPTGLVTRSDFSVNGAAGGGSLGSVNILNTNFVTTSVNISSNQAYFTVLNSGGTGVYTVASLTAGFGMNGIVKIPVQGWSSGQLLSSDSDTRVVAAYASGLTPSGTLTNSFNTVKFGSVSSDTHGGYNTTTGAYTVPVTGYYQVSGYLNIGHTSVAVGNAIGISIYSSYAGSNLFQMFSRVADTTVTGFMVNTSGVLYATAGSTIEIRGYSSGTSPSYSAALGGNGFSIQRISGPSQIAASETVAARYYQTATNTVASGTTTYIDFQGKNFDSHGAVSGAGGGASTTNGSGWKFVCPISGKYRVSPHISMTAFSGTSTLVVYIYVNAGALSNHSILTSATSFAWSLGDSTTVQCNSGDSIQIAVTQNTGSNQTTLGNYAVNVSIERIGN